MRQVAERRPGRGVAVDARAAASRTASSPAAAARIGRQRTEERLALGARQRRERDPGAAGRERPGDRREPRAERAVVLHVGAGDERVGDGGQQALGVAQQIFPTLALTPWPTGCSPCSPRTQRSSIGASARW